MLVGLCCDDACLFALSLGLRSIPLAGLSPPSYRSKKTVDTMFNQFIPHMQQFFFRGKGAPFWGGGGDGWFGCLSWLPLFIL